MAYVGQTLKCQLQQKSSAFVVCRNVLEPL